MPTLCINRPRCTVRRVSQRLEVEGPGDDGGRQVLRVVPLREVERVVATESTQFTASALAALLRREIPVAFLSRSGRFTGAFHPAGPAHGAWRLRQYRAALDEAFSLRMAGRIVAAKLYNQRRVLQRLAGNRGLPSGPAVARLGALMNDLARAGTVDELRGLEGAGAAVYFVDWASHLPEAFPFERRSQRPPLNAVNACLSFGATLLYQEMASCLHAHGLDPALGVLHATTDGRWSLALDLMEPFRPVLTEALALDVFTHGILNAGHFTPRHSGIYLDETGRAKFLVQYERRMERLFLSECAGHRTSLRQQVEAQAVMLKAALAEESRFEPFLMN